MVARKACILFPYSFWSGELRSSSATRISPPFIPTRLTAPKSPMHYRAFSLTWLCKFTGTKESVCIRKEFNSQRIGLGHQHGRRFIVWGTNMAAVTSCENTLYPMVFNMWLSTLEISAAQLRSVTEISPKSPFSLPLKQGLGNNSKIVYCGFIFCLLLFQQSHNNFHKVLCPEWQWGGLE